MGLLAGWTAAAATRRVARGKAREQPSPEEQILAGQRALKAARCRVGGVFLALALLFEVAFEYLWGFTAKLSTCNSEWGPAGLWFLSQLFNSPRLVCVSLAPLAGARHWLQLALVLNAILLLRLVPGVGERLLILEIGLQRARAEAPVVLYLGLVLMAAFGLLRALRFTQPAEIQRYMWDIIVGVVFASLLFDLLFATENALSCNKAIASWGRLPASALWFSLLVSPNLRQQVQARVHRLLLHRSSSRAAAAVAGLVGGTGAAEALSKATARFRTVTMSDIEVEEQDSATEDQGMMNPTASSTPSSTSSASWSTIRHPGCLNPTRTVSSVLIPRRSVARMNSGRSNPGRPFTSGISARSLPARAPSRSVFIDPGSFTADPREVFARSVPADLGSCDAFVSHSWSDDTEAKWEALHRWRARFLFTEGREPRLWIDRCCMEKTSIDTDLECLPFFLSGCKTLLVLGSESYLSRLWCIMELVTFAHMKGGCEQIAILPLSDDESEQEDMDFIRAGCLDFDVSDCVCSHWHDKVRLLDIIRAAWGDEKGFNKFVRKLFCRLAGRRLGRNADLSEEETFSVGEGGASSSAGESESSDEKAFAFGSSVVSSGLSSGVSV